MKQIHDSALELSVAAISLFCPVASLAKPAIDLVQNISNAILIEKLKRFFNNVGYAKSEWESFANKNLNPDSPSYAETMKRIVYVIDSISDERKIDVYANITRAYMEDKLTEDVFFELSEIIGSLPYNKMMSLKLFCT